MKTCKFCNAELPEESTVCPSCGKDNAEVTEQAPAAPVEETGEAPVTEAVPETAVEEKPAEEKAAEEKAAEDKPTEEKAVEEKPAEKLSAGKTVLAIVAVVAVVILALAVLLGVKYKAQGEEAAVPAVTEAVTTEATVETEPPTIPADGNPDDVTCKGTYYADDAAVIAARDTVVATAGEHELTLSQLQVFYWMEVRNFLTQYGAYAAYFGLDHTQDLDTQICPMSEEPLTWHQYFLDAALYAWGSYCSMAAEADLNGFEITEEQRLALEKAGEELEEAAQANGMESAAAMIHSSLGAAAELEDYVYFMEQYYKANGYYNHLSNSIQPSQQELEDFFEAHADGYAASGITKDSKSVNVRHILIYPEGADGSNIFTEEFSEEAWAASEAAANALLEEFLAGETTEEAFAALANEHSQDPGSNTNGGLYEGVTEGEMVAAFNDWCFDAARQVGDTGVVKTEYGYHVMYFSGSQTLWQQYAQSDFVSEKATAMANEIADANPLTVHYGDILLARTELT